MATLERRSEAFGASSELQRLADVPPEVEWFTNPRNSNTRKAYQTDICDFSA